MIILDRSSGYTELDVVVRAYDKMTNTIDYAWLDSNGEVVWVDGKNMGGGASREAKIILEELKELNYKELP